MITIIIPANNEEGYIGDCLDRILLSDTPETPVHAVVAAPVQVLVVANACTDSTVAEARAFTSRFNARDWQLDVLDLAEGGKINALNAGDQAALNDLRVYVDADIHVSSGLIAGIVQALDRPGPSYAGGRPRIRPAQSWVSERYARFWERLPFMAEGVPGCGVYAVNAAGRDRWKRFPDIIADDTYVRMHFKPSEMYGTEAPYSWPITEGFANLVRVRRRQDIGLAQMRAAYPDLTAQLDPTAPSLGRLVSLFLRDPVGFSIYSAVAVVVRSPVLRNRNAWERGR